MPRRVQDIIPNNHRSIRDIPVERNRHPTHEKEEKVPVHVKSRPKTTDVRNTLDLHDEKALAMTKKDAEEVTETRKSAESEKKSPIHHRHAKKKGSRVWLFVFMGIVITTAGVGYIASVYFSKATFTIVPKKVPVTVNSTYVAESTAGKTSLVYEISALKDTVSSTVPSSDGPKISTSAKGKVTLYNNFSAQPLRLVAGTRLANDSGLIYRLTDSVSVPGYTSTNGVTKPGSLSATITASEAGPTYNISKSDPVSDFKIVAYKGTSKYELIYARLATDVSGGFTGSKKTVNPTVLASTTATLQDTLTKNILARLQASIPDGYIMYPNAYVTSFGQPTISGSDPKSAQVTLSGTVYGILFKKKDFITRVATEQAISVFDNYTFEADGLDSLSFTIVNQKDFSPEKKNALSIRLKGDLTLVGSIPVETLKNKLKGLSLANTATVFKEYKPIIEIDKSSGEITPPWSKVPSDTSRISIKVLTK